MQIKSIKKIDDGRRGLAVKHVQPLEKNGEAFELNLNSEYGFRPTKEVTSNMDKLKIHILRLCRAWSDNWDRFLNDEGTDLAPQAATEIIKSKLDKQDYMQARDAIDDLIVTGITCNLEDFVLIGKTKSTGNTNVNLVTGNIKPNMDYPHYDQVIKIVEDVYSAVESYTAGQGEEVMEATNGEEVKPANGDAGEKGMITSVEDVPFQGM